MIHFAKNKATVSFFILLAVILILRLSCFFFVVSSEPSRIFRIDSSSYNNSARALLETGNFAISPEKPHLLQTVRTPGYPFFIASIYRIFGERVLPVIVIQILISIGTIFLTFKIGQLLWNSEKIALLSSLILSLDIVSFNYSQVLLTETSFTFLITASIVIGMFLLNKKQINSYALLYGLILALATLVRPISYYLIFPCVVGFIIFWRIDHKKWKDILVVLSLIILPYTLIVGGWQMRNYLAVGSFEFSHVKHINLFLWRGSGIIAQQNNITFKEAYQKSLKSLPERGGLPTNKIYGLSNELYGLYKKKGLMLIKQHPFLFIKDQFKGCKRTLLGTGDYFFLTYLGVKTGFVGDLFRLSIKEYISKWIIKGSPLKLFVGFFITSFSIGYLFLLYAGIIYSLFKMARGENSSLSVHILICGIIAYFLIISSGPESYERFRVPITPLFALYGGMGIYYLFESFKPKH